MAAEELQSRKLYRGQRIATSRGALVARISGLQAAVREKLFGDGVKGAYDVRMRYVDFWDCRYGTNTSKALLLRRIVLLSFLQCFRVAVASCPNRDL